MDITADDVVAAEPDVRLALNVVFSVDQEARHKSVAIEGSVCVGRAPNDGVDLVIDDPRISSRHAIFRNRRGHCLFEDLGSTNGSFLDGKRAERGELVRGAIVRLGDTVFELDRPLADPSEGGAVGRSYAFARALAEADRAAGAPVAVLLLGETGTGKEVFAWRIHERSGRPGKFVAVNCAAIPSTLLEAYLFGHKKGAYTGATSDARGMLNEARGGTVFLDEVGELALDLQAKLLRVIETQEFVPVGGTSAQKADVRFVSATNAPLAAAIKAGTFRADLYARIAVYPIHLAPLRQRRSDVPLLLEHFLQKLAPERTFSWTAGFVEAMVLHSWPWNVRELKSVVERILIDHEGAETLERQDFLRALKLESSSAEGDAGARVLRGSPSKEELLALFRQHGGNVEAVAQHLGRHRQQVYRWLKRHGLRLSELRRVDDSE
jgi:transcriptional regulator with PAS, ATPase and Fis domain